MGTGVISTTDRCTVNDMPQTRLEAGSSLWAIAKQQLADADPPASNAEILRYMKALAAANDIPLDESNNAANTRDLRANRTISIPKYEAPSLDEVKNGNPIARFMEGSGVSEVQSLLRERGVEIPEASNGVFDSTMDAKVREFQRANGLKDDGIVGPLTLAKLRDTSTIDECAASDTPTHVGDLRAPTPEQKKQAAASTTNAANFAQRARYEQLKRENAGDTERALSTTETSTPGNKTSSSALYARINGPSGQIRGAARWGADGTVIDTNGERKRATGVYGADFGARASVIRAEGQVTMSGERDKPNLAVAGRGDVVIESELSAQGWTETDKTTGREVYNSKAGAFAGAMSKADGSLRSRWVDVTVGTGVGAGVGAKGAAHVGREAEGVYGLGGEFWAGAGAGLRGKLGVAIKTDQIASDYHSAEKWVGDTASSAGHKVNETWNSAWDSMKKTWSNVTSEQGFVIGN